MKDYIIEMVTGKKHTHNNVKAESANKLRLRLIKDRILLKEEKAVVYATNARRVYPDTVFRMIGVMWFDGYNMVYLWMEPKGKVYKVSEKTGKLSPFDGRNR